PGTLTFQATFLSLDHSAGRRLSSLVADPFGPRNCGQSPQVAAAGRDIRRPGTITDRILMIGSLPAEVLGGVVAPWAPAAVRLTRFFSPLSASERGQGGRGLALAAPKTSPPNPPSEAERGNQTFNHLLNRPQRHRILVLDEDPVAGHDRVCVGRLVCDLVARQLLELLVARLVDDELGGRRQGQQDQSGIDDGPEPALPLHRRGPRRLAVL